MDTIFALATARGKAGVAIIRMSGPRAWDAVRQLCGSVPQPRISALRILTGQDGSTLDEALVLTFEAGASFTGERVAELQIHGSQAVIAAVLSELSDIQGLRLAEPGEFTRRALENNRLDLAQVEGLSDLIDAETESQRKQAQRVLSGVIGDYAEIWRGKLIHAAALLEATIDFADEEVPIDVSPDVIVLLDQVLQGFADQTPGIGVAERIRDGFEVAIVGPPNAGKSTLLNKLAGREAALTSEHAGTTRDVVEVRLDLSGLAVTFLDTAGLRQTDDAVEGMGIDRAVQRAGQADLRVFLLDETGAPVSGLTPKDDDIILRGKADLYPSDGLAVSGKTGAGIGDLVQRIDDILSDRAAGAAVFIRERHRVAITRAQGAIQSAMNRVKTGPEQTELAAEDLRSAIRSIESLVGRIDVEDILDDIFSRFCLGK